MKNLLMAWIAKSWIQPLPCETPVATIIGSALGVTLVNEKALAAPAVLSTFEAVAFVFGILIFSVFMHFASTALFKRRYDAYLRFIVGCVLVIIVLNSSRVTGFSYSDDRGVQFKPDSLAFATTTLLLIWLCCQNLLALMSKD